MPKISSSGAAPKKTPAPAAGAAKKKPAASKAKAKVVDTFIKGGLEIGSIRATRGVDPVPKVVLSDGIRSSLDLGALSEIETFGRHAVGFRLDGGSVRNLWVSLRRFSEGSKKGYELFFFTHGGAPKQLRERLETLGAKKGTFQFSAAELEGAEGKASLKRSTSSNWSPSSSSALVLQSEGKWKVEFNPGEPEALKGAMRIRAYGTDAQAGKAFEEVVKKLGLQSVLAPSTDEALEKLKIARHLWQHGRAELKPLSSRPFAEVTLEELKAALDDHDVKASLKAIAAADPKEEAIAKRLKLAALFVQKDPEAFVEWAASNYYGQHGILPGSGYDYSSIESSMEGAGISKTAMAKAKLPSEEDAERLLLLGLLAKTDKSSALGILSRDSSAVSLEDLNDAAKAAGVSKERLAQLRYEEVYPGYFTVVDPAQVDELYAAGARYLYSTYDDAERVMSMLTGGQKSSLTRFSEGLIVQGKSSSSDFGTGGAVAVFTRLVTKSAVEKGKKAKGSTGYYYEGKFNDWGGSRPYKVIINRAVLARTDWWGFNGDNYGKSTGLKPENFGKALVKEIEKNYSSSNELMFPIGNDPAYADFVVCGTEEQKDKLVAAMKKAGMSEYNGKPLDEFVRVEPTFFDY